MTTTIEAVFRNGVFEPLGPVKIAEGTRVQMSVTDSASRQPDPDWLVQLRKRQDELRAKYGEFPDSTPLIREDRDRDI